MSPQDVLASFAMFIMSLKPIFIRILEPVNLAPAALQENIKSGLKRHSMKFKFKNLTVSGHSNQQFFYTGAMPQFYHYTERKLV